LVLFFYIKRRKGKDTGEKRGYSVNKKKNTKNGYTRRQLLHLPTHYTEKIAGNRQIRNSLYISILEKRIDFFEKYDKIKRKSTEGMNQNALAVRKVCY